MILSRFSVVCTVMFALLVVPSAGQQKQDTIYQKDGKIIIGTIVEDIPNSTIKIRVDIHSIWTLYYSDIEKIAHAPAGGQSAIDTNKQSLSTDKQNGISIISKGTGRYVKDT